MIQGQKEKEIAKEVLNLAEALGEKSRRGEETSIVFLRRPGMRCALLR